MVVRNGSNISIITGAASGLGRATAIRLAKRGDRVALCDVSESSLEETCSLVRNNGGEATSRVIDVRDGVAVKNWCAEVVKQLGKIDYLFSNAGVTSRSAVCDMEFDEWRRLIDTHVTGSFHVCQAALAYMVEHGSGAIVVTSSDYAVIGMRHASNYAAAKTALYAFTKALALEFAPYGIRVNAVGPGPIDTPLLRSRGTPAEWQERVREYEARLPMQRLGQPEDVASVVDFLLSDRASYITGQLLQPNGGQVMW
jgi:NAD(P)-dependent dehydrogenase (short-subunit alcohol dehydrogenase family)